MKAKGKFRTSSRSREFCVSAGVVITILGIWWVVTSAGAFTPIILPSPGKVLESFLKICEEGYRGISLPRHFADSMFRLLAAFALSALTAVPLGILSGFHPKIRAAFDPIVEFYRPLPPLGYYTLLVLWMGIDNASKITLLYLAGFAPIFIACVSGVGKIRADLIDGAYTVGANSRQVMVYVIFPACLPDIFTGLRTSLGVSYTTLVAAEMVAAMSGIGWMVLDASKFLRSDIVFVGIIIMGLTGILLDQVLRAVEARVVPWKSRGE
ncbi:MAG: ABC transporter permease subunit [Synergistaceae bacterium]|nr:ABC transporter permease subunit [Synergistaceae bacterium]